MLRNTIETTVKQELLSCAPEQFEKGYSNNPEIYRETWTLKQASGGQLM